MEVPMKSLVLAASAAILLAGVSIAGAADAGKDVALSPANINKGVQSEGLRKSGNQPEATARKKVHVVRKHKAMTTGKAKAKVPLSPADINKGAGTGGARKSGDEPNSMAK
jgi:hypothetical protein